MNRTLIFVTCLLTLTACGRSTYRLVRPISCESILKVQLGQSKQDVEALIGSPASTLTASDGDRTETRTNADRVSFYGPSANLDPFDRLDQLVLFMEHDRLVYLRARQSLRTAHDPILGLELKGDPRTSSQRMMGPAFESIFSCGPDFSRSRLPSDVTIVQ